MSEVLDTPYTLSTMNNFFYDIIGISLNFLRLLLVVITPSVTSLRGENDSKPSDEFQAISVLALKGLENNQTKPLIKAQLKLSVRVRG